MLDKKQIEFIAKRKKLVDLWPAAGTILCIILVILPAWLFFQAPLLINPFTMMEKIEAGTLESSTLLLAAALLPVMTLTCIVILIVMVIFAFAAFSTEKKHLQVIEKLLKEREAA